MEVINQHLKHWTEGIVGADVSVSNEFLETTEDRHVTFYLYQLLPSTSRQKKTGGPLQITLRYLVSTAAKSISESHLLLEEIVFEAMQSNEFHLELAPVDPAVFISLGITPRPCFWLCIEHFKEREKRPVSLVTERVDLRVSSLASLSGIVKSENGIPIGGARVNLDRNDGFATTDANGYFQFSAISPEPTRRELAISYQQFTHRIIISLSESPLEILLKPLKERK